jgi:hypothetical protein
MWSAVGVTAVAAATVGVIMALPSVERTAAAPASTTTTTTTSEPVVSGPTPHALTVAQAVTDAIAKADNAAYQSRVCASATQDAKAPIAYPPGARLVGAHQVYSLELRVTIRVTPRLDLIASVQEVDDWCLVDITHCPMKENGDYDMGAALDNGYDVTMYDCAQRPLRIE